MPVEDEKPSELQARLALQAVLKRPLTRYATEPDRKTPDYVDANNEAFEVKRLTAEEFLALRDQVGQQSYFKSPALSRSWVISINGPTLGDLLPPTPDYPDDDPELISALEADGWTVKRKADLIAEHEERRRQPPPKRLQVSRVPRQLVSSLSVLEAAGISNTREGRPGTREQWRALAQFGALTRGGIGLSYEPDSDGPGIQLCFSYGLVGTGQADVIAARVQIWLDSDDSKKLRGSLWPTFSLRHGVLVFDATEPEFRSAQEPGFIPTTPVSLPSEVDVLWCLLGSCLLRYAVGEDWQRFEV